MSCVSLTQCSRFTAVHGHGGTLAEAPHSHTFNYEVTFYGPLNAEGYLIDFRVVQDFLQNQINTRLNGADLNTLFAQPTTDALAVWIFNTGRARFPQIRRVKVAEEPDRWIEYQGEN